jgi:GTP pyrophosphokinase
MADPCYSERLDRAIALATDSFRTVRRKGSGIPYLTHLMQVMVYVGEAGGDEDQMIAAVLHDYLEDIDGATEDELARDFGDRVARLVADLSDTVVRPKPPWRERKERYLSLLKTKPAELKLISCADKLHNAQSIHRDYRIIGDRLWDRFTADRDQTLWYYRGVVDALSHDWSSPLLDRLTTEVKAIHQMGTRSP